MSVAQPATGSTAVGRRRAVFIDVDGTHALRGDVPPGHVEAVRRARAAGHLVFLCTGRPASMVPERIRGAGFDGLVAAAGAYVELGGQVVRDRRFPAELATRVVSVLDAHDVAYVLEAPEALDGPVGVGERLTTLLAGRLGHAAGHHEGPSDILDVLRTADDLGHAAFGKVTCFDSPVPVDTLAREMGHEVDALPSSIPGMGDSSGELFMRGVHKAVGIRAVVERLGLAREDVVGIGDGPNDVEMIEYAGVGVAIEGSDPRVLAVADRTAAGPEHEGLVAAFADLSLI